MRCGCGTAQPGSPGAAKAAQIHRSAIVGGAVYAPCVGAEKLVGRAVHIGYTGARHVVIRAVHVEHTGAQCVVIRAVHIAHTGAQCVVIRAVHVAHTGAQCIVSQVGGLTHAGAQRVVVHRLVVIVQHGSGVAVDGGMEPTMRAHPGSMPVGVPRRRCHVVAMRRVVVVPVIPRCRLPSRHITQRRESGYREYRHTGRRVPIHWATIRVTENREPVDIITCVGPRYARVVTIRCYTQGTIRGIVSRRRNCARTTEQRSHQRYHD